MKCLLSTLRGRNRSSNDGAAFNIRLTKINYDPDFVGSFSLACPCYHLFQPPSAKVVSANLDAWIPWDGGFGTSPPAAQAIPAAEHQIEVIVEFENSRSDDSIVRCVSWQFCATCR